MVPPQLCCSALAAVLASKTAFPGSSAYTHSLTSYFSAQEAEVHPKCIVLPAGSQDVSRAVKVLAGLNCQFAVRSGGHSIYAGAANIEGAVTIDLQGLDAVSINEETSIVSVGPGARWGKVYAAAEAVHLGVPGGRVATVGVGGLSLGGGISSFSARRGWTCDSIVNHEIVLASGAVVNANATHNADLHRALRGGSNNFGIVTRFDFQGFEQGLTWGGNVDYDISTIDEQLVAASNLASSSSYDEYASLVHSFGYAEGQGMVVSNGLHYTKDEPFPATFKPLTDIPSLRDTLRSGNLTDFAIEGAQGNPDGFRALLATTTFRASLETFNASYVAWRKSVDALSSAKGLQYRLLLEPIPEATYKRAPPGSNSLGLEDEQGGLVIVGVALGWTNESDDALVTATAKQVVDEIEAEAKALGQYSDFVFLNYASPWQKVLQGYGPGNVAELKRVSRKYDPKGVFQKKVPGGFKLAGL